MEYGPKYWQKRTLAPSAFLLYLDIKGKIPKLIHHNLYFGDDWVKHFDEIFKQPSWSTEPSLYINKTSYIDPSVAPKGHETIFILVPVASKLTETAQSRQFVGGNTVPGIGVPICLISAELIRQRLAAPSRS